MASKIINRESANIIACYLFNRPHLTTTAQQTNRVQHSAPNINKPLDQFLRTYFSTHKYIGSTERGSISDKVYNLVRYDYLLSHLIRSKPFDLERPTRWSEQVQKEVDYKIQMLFSSSFYNAVDNLSLPKYRPTLFQVFASLAKQTVVLQVRSLFKELSLSLMKDEYAFDHASIVDKRTQYDLGDEDAAFSVSSIMNSRAPLTIRVNCLKITKHELVQKLQKQIKYRLMGCEHAPFGFKIVAPKNVNLMETEEFKNGYFQIQDEGSQLAALRAKCRPGDLVLDYCGGSGGKSLALAHLLQGKGQIFVHQPRQSALAKAKRRFARAGVQNVQFHNTEQSLNKIALGKMNWVVVDAPCTGTGTLRRNPDIKLKFSSAWLKTNVLLQRQIISRALKYLHRDGRLLYITCSLLRQQNEEQIKYLSELHNLQVDNDQVMRILPQKDGSDGFFAVVMKRKS